MTINRTVYFLAALLVVCLAFSYQMFAPFFTPALLALLFAIAFAPVYRIALGWFHRPGWAALVSTLFVFLVALLPFAVVTALLADDVATQIRAIEAASRDEGGLTPLLMARLQSIIHAVAPRLNLSEDYLMEQITSRAQSWAQAVLAFIGGIVVNAGSSIVDFALASVMLFFFFRDGANIRQAIADLMPISREDSAELFGVVHATVTANLYGVVGVALVQGVLTTIGLMIAGIPNAPTWGVFATLFAFIPFVGPPVVWVPAVIWLVNNGSYAQALFLTVWGVVAVGLADNFLRPALVGGKTHQHALLVFLSLLGGTAAFGVLGLFLGPLLVSVTIAVFKVLRRETLRS